jgi:hypothetical protein
MSKSPQKVDHLLRTLQLPQALPERIKILREPKKAFSKKSILKDIESTKESFL